MAVAEYTGDPATDLVKAGAALATAQPAFDPKPLDFAALWEAGGDEPDYLVHGVLALGEVMLLSADTGVGKTWLSYALAVAVVQGGEWLGRPVAQGRVLYIDEENPTRIPASRLQALGLQRDELGEMRYVGRQGLQVGDHASSDAWVIAVLESFNPQLVVIDTAMSATALGDVNDNSRAVALYKVLRGWAESYGCAVVLLHHERKQPATANSGGDQSHATMGARQMIGQADVQLMIRSAGARERSEGAETAQLVTPIKLRWGKLRDDVPTSEAEFARIESTKRGSQLLNAAVVPCDPPVSDLAVEIARVVRAADRVLQTKEIAELVARDPKNDAFKKAMTQAVAQEWIVLAPGSQKGKYVAGPVAPGDAIDADDEPGI